MASAPTTYSVTARVSAPGHAEIDAGTDTLPIDAGWATEPSGHPGPAELLAAAFAACLVKNLERSGQLLDFHYESARVIVTARRQDAPPKFVEIGYELVITTSESDHRVQLVHRNLQNYGTVYNTLAAVCDVHGTATGVRASA
jgi:uncharacterized OsmC-like protein